MELRFIGQGYNLGANTSVAKVLIDSFANNEFHTFKCMVAFASPSGVSGLTEHVNNSRAHIATTRVVVGVDQGATSKEALERFLEWDADVFVFYTAQPNIFHPKIYIFEGENTVSILIGSNNLTEMGLVKNIESSVLINFNKEEIEGDNLLDEIHAYFDTILAGENPNLQPLTVELIQQLVEKGVVPNEMVRRAKFSKEDVPGEEGAELGNRIRDLFPSIGLQGLPDNFKPQRRQRPVVESEIDAVETHELIEATEAPVLVPVPVVAAPIADNAWNFADGSNVLIAEIGGPGRWSQISFAKANFQTFFMLPTNVGGTGTINLKYLQTNGNLQNDVEIATSAKVKASSNYNLEPAVVRASTVPYNSANRPIIFFIKIDATHFIYHFETNGTPLYNQLNAALGVRNGNFLRRRNTTVAVLCAACPALSI
jgi:HKD family nuclease